MSSYAFTIVMTVLVVVQIAIVVALFVVLWRLFTYLSHARRGDPEDVPGDRASPTK